MAIQYPGDGQPTAKDNTACRSFSHSAIPAWHSLPLDAPVTPLRGAQPVVAPYNSPRGHAVSENATLAALSASALRNFAPHLRRVLLHQGDVLFEKDSETKYVYFVEKGLVSLVVNASRNVQFEVAMIGCNGVAGITAAMGNSPSIHRAVVQMAGKAQRLPVGVLQEEWKRNPSLQAWTFTHSNLLLAQVSQNALCSRIHALEERLCRWLLTARDCTGSNNLNLTHDNIARMLGVRRPGVTILLGALHQAGFLECGRGRVTITDTRNLEASACDCYDVLRRQFQLFASRIA